MTRRNLLLLTLLVSVGINLFLLGGIAIRVANSQDFREARPLPPNIGWVIRDLEDSRQTELMETLRPFAEQVAPLRRAMFEAQREVNRLMSATDYDEEALSAAFARLREASQAYTSLSHSQTIGLFGQLTEEERKAATEFVRRRGPREGRDGRDGFFPGPGGPGRRPPGPDFRPAPPPDSNQ